MENRYKIIISNKNLYKEIELADDAGELKVGTGTVSYTHLCGCAVPSASGGFYSDRQKYTA